MVKIPLFLAPAFTEIASRTACRSVVRSFSSTACNEARSRTKRSGGRDSNKQRGVSAMRSTGTRHELSVERTYPELPRPRLPSVRREILQHEQYKTDPDHGLYGFFNSARETVRPGADEAAFGRAWEEGDLTFKSFEDLHSLWWKCHMELNRISTRSSEHTRLRLGYGKNELGDRKRAVSCVPFMSFEIILPSKDATSFTRRYEVWDRLIPHRLRSAYESSECTLALSLQDILLRKLLTTRVNLRLRNLCAQFAKLSSIASKRINMRKPCSRTKVYCN